MYFTITTDPGGSVATVILSDGETVTLRDDDKSFEALKDYLLDNDADDLEDAEVRRIAHTPSGIFEKMRRVSERVSIAGNTLLFDGDPIHGALSETILNMAFADTDGGFQALVNFLEKLQTNPNEESRNSLYEWIVRHDLRILPSGSFTAYKGVRPIDGVSYSVNAGSAYVDGKLVTGRIPNVTGSVIEMPRSQVQHDTSIGCSTGLHAGTWDYATWFSGERIVLVEINPRDVVSVPDDCAFKKLRVSRYVVLDEIDHEIDVVSEYSSLYDDYDDEDGDNWDDRITPWYSEDEDEEDEYDSFLDTAYSVVRSVIDNLTADGTPSEAEIEGKLGLGLADYIVDLVDEYADTIPLFDELDEGDLRQYTLKALMTDIF